MNSLEDLNDFADEPVDYNDQAGFSISVTSLGNQTVSVNEGQSFQVPLGIVLNSLTSGPSTMYYEINLNNAGGNATLSWPSATGVTFSNPSPNVYRATGVSSILKWDTVKSPTVFLGRDYATNFTFTASLNAGAGNVFTWTNTVNITNTSELNTLTPNAVSYDEDTPMTFGAGNVIQITDTENPPSAVYRLVGLTSNASAGTFNSSFVGANAVSVLGNLTLVDTKTSVNSYLQGLGFVPALDFDQAFQINWTLTNPVSNIQTVALQQVNIGQTNQEITNMGLTRTYVENGYGVLFPTSVPQIDENIGGATYTISWQLANDIGVIGLGTNFATPDGWSPVTRTFTYVGSKTDCNNIMGQVRFFPNQGVSSTTTVTYRQSRNGIFQISQNFTLAGSPTTLITGPSTVVVAEDGSFVATQTVLPHYSQPYAFLIQPQIAGVPRNDLVQLQPNAGWTYIGNSSVQTGIYRNFSAAGNITTHINNVANLASATQVVLRPDVDSDFVLAKTFGYGSQYNGNAFVSGTLYYANTAVDITPSAEYTWSPTGFYNEDQSFSVAYSVDDAATDGNYTITIAQQTPNPLISPQAGNFTINGVASGTSITWSGTKAQVNGKVITFDPPPDFTGNIILAYSQTKTAPLGNVVQAANVTQTRQVSSTHAEYNIPSTLTYSEDNFANVIYGNYGITDTDVGASYTVSINQIAPTQASKPGRFRIEGQGWQAVGSNITISGVSASTFNNYVIQYAPPFDFTGQITLHYNQSKTSDGQNLVQANAVPITMTCVTTHDEYFAPASLATRIKEPISFNGLFGILDETVDTTYTISFNDLNNLGLFSGNNQSYWSFTSTKTDCNLAINSLSWSPNGSIAGNTTIQFQIVRTIDNKTLANVSVPLTLTVPALGDIWNGGWYAGTYNRTNGNATPTHHLVAASGTSTLAVRTLEWSTALSNTAPTDNSLYNGATNTSGLYNFGYTNVLYNLPAVRFAQDLSYNYYTDWYLPSEYELSLLMSRISGLYRQGEIYPRPWWSSTVKNSGNVALFSVVTGTMTTSTYIGIKNALGMIRSVRAVAV